MLEIRRFDPLHYKFVVQDIPSEGSGFRVSGDAIYALTKENSWTGFVDGNPVFCAGTVVQWPGRHLAWAYLTDATAAHMLWITRETRRVLDQVKGRIETTVRTDFAAGHRWAKMLGFEIETPVLKAYGPEGEDHTSYTRHN